MTTEQHSPAWAQPIHLVPQDDDGLMPCCQQTPFEVPITDRMTEYPGLATCSGKATTAVRDV